jgi:hypothetical protein
VTLAIDFKRESGCGTVEWRVTGHSNKRKSPLWCQVYSEDDHRNLPASIGGAVSDVVFYRPTDAKFFRGHQERILTGWESPTLPF